MQGGGPTIQQGPSILQDGAPTKQQGGGTITQNINRERNGLLLIKKEILLHLFKDLFTLYY